MGDAELPFRTPEIEIMGMPAATPDVTTIAELLALPADGMRHELLDGVHVVTPAPALLHQLMVREIASRLLSALEHQNRHEVLWSPADIVLGVGTLVQPDVFVVERLDPGPLEEMLFFDHPSGHTRILTGMRWKAEHLEAAP
jgi:Uma2 family endonuclease